MAALGQNFLLIVDFVRSYETVEDSWAFQKLVKSESLTNALIEATTEAVTAAFNMSSPTAASPTPVYGPSPDPSSLVGGGGGGAADASMSWSEDIAGSILHYT